jgi:hypothetical protein
MVKSVERNIFKAFKITRKNILKVFIGHSCTRRLTFITKAIKVKKLF